MSTQEIAPKDIEKALAKMWESRKKEGATRASLFNLVIHAKHDNREEYLQKTMRSVIRKFPCRIIMIIEDETANRDYCKTTVTDLKADDNEKGTFCEVITFEVSPSYRERIPFLIQPHLIPDLPVYLLWGDNPTKKDPLSFQLEDLSTRTIFDSETTDHMTQFAKSVLQLKDQVNCDIADLNWARMEDWRELFTITFNQPQKIECLNKASKLTISYNDRKTKSFCHNKIQATYLQAWIASRLGWTFQHDALIDGKVVFEYEKAAHLIKVELSPKTYENLKPGRILSVEIEACDGNHYLFHRKAKSPHMAIISHSDQNRCEMPTYHLLDREQSGRSLVREIYHQGTNPHFVGVLQLLSKYKEGIVCS